MTLLFPSRNTVREHDPPVPRARAACRPAPPVSVLPRESPVAGRTGPPSAESAVYPSPSRRASMPPKRERK
eukprot:2868158-Prymnesium_polylepis.1